MCMTYQLIKSAHIKSRNIGHYVGMAFDPVAFKKTKHILRAAEFLRDLVAREVVVLQHVSGSVMVADLLTKSVARAMFVFLLFAGRRAAA